MSFGVWMAWDEYKPCYEGTNTHNPSVGRWILAGGAWLTEQGNPVVFDCIADAAAEAERQRDHRRHAHPPFSYIGPRPYRAADAGERLACAGPDLSALGGFFQ